MNKNQSLKLPSYLKAIRSHVKQCACCSTTPTDIAHYSGEYSDKLGKGRGCKSHDYAVAYLCRSCHTKLDDYKDGNGEGRTFDFLYAIKETAKALAESVESTIGAKESDKKQAEIARLIVVSMGRWQMWAGRCEIAVDALAELRDEIEEMAKWQD